MSNYPGRNGSERRCSLVKDEFHWPSLFNLGEGSILLPGPAEGVLAGAESPWKDLFGQVVLGGGEFINRIRGMLKGKELSPEIVARRELIKYPTIEEIVSRVSKAFGVKGERIQLGGGRLNPARNVALYLAKRYTGLSNDEIGRHFGGLCYSGVSKAAGRVREAMVTDRKLAKIVIELDSHFKA